MNRRWFICLAAYFLTLALLLTISPASTDFGVVRLWGSPRVLMVYLGASLPMGWLLVRRFPVLHLTHVVLSIAGIGCLIALAISADFSSLGVYSAGYAQRALTRGIVGLLLVLPLCSLFQLAFISTSERSGPRNIANFLLAIACTAILPAVYVEVQIKRLRDAWQTQTGGGRIVSELRSLNCLWELRGETSTERGRLSAEIRALQRQAQALHQKVQTLLPAGAHSTDYQQRAMELLSLDRAVEADQVLARLAPSVDVCLLRAICARELHHWRLVERYSRSVLDSAPSQRLAIELLGEALHQQGRYEDAQANYQRILSNDQSAGNASTGDLAIHLRLAKLFMDKGDRAMAIQHLESARQFDSSIDVVSQHRTILQSSCSLRRN